MARHPSPGRSPRARGASRGAGRASALVLAALMAGCALPGSGGGPATPDLPAVELELRTDRPGYDRFQPIRMILTVRNDGRAPVTLAFPTSQRYDFQVMDEDGGVLWRWSDGRAFAQVPGEEHLQPGESLSWLATFDGALAPGEYAVEGGLPGPLAPLRDEATFQVY
jgi:hypothetical protein